MCPCRWNTGCEAEGFALERVGYVFSQLLNHCYCPLFFHIRFRLKLLLLEDVPFFSQSIQIMIMCRKFKSKTISQMLKMSFVRVMMLQKMCVCLCVCVRVCVWGGSWWNRQCRMVTRTRTITWKSCSFYILRLIYKNPNFTINHKGKNFQRKNVSDC